MNGAAQLTPKMKFTRLPDASFSLRALANEVGHLGLNCASAFDSESGDG